jgi:hypothetical protein
MGILAFLCPATGKSVFTDLEIDQSIYSLHTEKPALTYALLAVRRTT